jgi:hypothetical protein
VLRRSRETFEAVFKPYYVITHDDNRKVETPPEQGGKPYDIQVAASKYLKWGSYAGITEVAERALNKIINGEYNMSTIDSDTSKQGEVKVPSAKSLGDALAKATKTPKRASTKSGTTAAAKKPGKVVKTATKPAAKTAAKPAAKTAAKPAAKTAAKPAAKTVSKGNGAVGRPSGLDGTKTLKVLVEENPRREGSQGYDNWKIIKRYDGKTVEGYLAAGGGSNHLRWDLDHKNVKLV